MSSKVISEIVTEVTTGTYSTTSSASGSTMPDAAVGYCSTSTASNESAAKQARGSAIRAVVAAARPSGRRSGSTRPARVGRSATE
ncbi:unannotated protein [freshwater metagenome]|uniref:Unannotated protein n=1 Tax=freshwater metagenome TaxID=449393 RepID=A0A6J6DHD6_9ZZZZ